jgi:hypothetical protein
LKNDFTFTSPWSLMRPCSTFTPTKRLPSPCNRSSRSAQRDKRNKVRGGTKRKRKMKRDQKAKMRRGEVGLVKSP